MKGYYVLALHLEKYLQTKNSVGSKPTLFFCLWISNV